jgi:hypothetical protein
MIRKAVIMVLTLAAVGTGVLSLSSMVAPLIWESTSASQWSCVCVNKTQLTITQSLANDPVLLRDLADGRKWQLRQYAYPEFHVIWRKKTYVGSDSYLVKYTDKTCIAVPLLLPFLAFSLYPTIVLAKSSRRWRQMRRRKRGLCIACGYDLTGNTSGVCPGCGTEFDPSTLPEERLDLE